MPGEPPVLTSKGEAVSGPTERPPIPQTAEAEQKGRTLPGGVSDNVFDKMVANRGKHAQKQSSERSE